MRLRPFIPAARPSEATRAFRLAPAGRGAAVAWILAGLLGVAVLPVRAADEARERGGAVLKPCRLDGVDTSALCGSVRRPLDPAAPDGPVIDVHFAVLPALARQRKPDPVFFLAGGPGQSAIGLAGTVRGLLGRLNARRDLVVVDQRGVGRSAALDCPQESERRPLAEQFDPARARERMQACLEHLRTLPHGDLRQYTTTRAMQDLDAVRATLGAERINVVGASYGTRAALEYQRQFPQRVRRVVLDGVAPPDMVLPASMPQDVQVAFDGLLAACERDADCAQRHPGLRARWQALRQSLPREVVMRHPLTGREERVTLTRPMLLTMVRPALYVPVLASALPEAIAQAVDGRFDALVGLASALTNRRAGPLSAGMHFSVVCAEDVPRWTAMASPPAGDFDAGDLDPYRQLCPSWPRGEVPPAFYELPAAPAPTLVLSGGLDPVTPPRHGERVTRALGERARHVVVPNAGHGVIGLPCMRDVLFRFVDVEDASAALQVDASCAVRVPRPPVFRLPQVEGGR